MAYDPAETIATHCLLLQEIQIGFGFTFLVPAHPGRLGQNPESRKTVVVVVLVVVVVTIYILQSSWNILWGKEYCSDTGRMTLIQDCA